METNGNGIKVKDLMEPVGANQLHPDHSVLQAVSLMKQQALNSGSSSGMVVLNTNKKLVGVVSIKDIIRAVIPSYMDKHIRSFTWNGMLEEQAEKSSHIKVADIMSRNLVTIGPDDSLMRCANLMIDNNLQRLPVLDDQSQILGIIHISNLYNYIADLIQTQNGTL